MKETGQPLAVRLSRDRWDICAQLIVPVVALLWGVFAWWLVQRHDDKNKALQVKVAVRESELRHSEWRMQLVASLIPILVSDNESGKKIVREALESIDPAFWSSQFGDTLLNAMGRSATSAAEREDSKKFAERVREESTTQGGLWQGFFRHLGNARIYRSFGLDGPASQEYMAAANLIPSSRLRVDLAKIKEAQSAYDQARFEQAVDMFEQAFREISATYN